MDIQEQQNGAPAAMPARCTLEQPCSVPFLSLALHSPPSLAADVAPTPSPSISFSHCIPSFGLFCPPPGPLSFALSIVFYSPSRSSMIPLSTLFAIAEPLALFLPLSLFLSYSHLFRPSSVLRHPAFVLVAPSDCRRFSVFFSHQVAALSVSFSPPIPSLPRVERETALSLSSSFVFPSFSPFLPFSLLAVLFYPVLSSRLPSSFSLSFSLTSSTSVRGILSVLSRAGVFRFLASR